ncbi:MAG: hypothetical protein ACREVI_11290 [Steroidobacteraceae bacterium]
MKIPNSAAMRARALPLASSAAIELSKVGGSLFAAMTRISSRFASIALRYAASIAAGVARSTGGNPP